MRGIHSIILVALLGLCLLNPAQAAASGGRSITSHRIDWPSGSEMWEVLTLQDHAVRQAFLSLLVLGGVGGIVGTFLLLRRRSLLSDTVSHCTLPGIAAAYLIAEAAGGDGKSLPYLLAGASVSGLLGMGAVNLIRSHTRVKDDAALAIVLSVFFGLGMALLVIIQQLPLGNAAGLSRFIYGKAASLTRADSALIGQGSGIVAVIAMLFFKELRLLCFDADFAKVQGWPVRGLDLLLMALVTAITVIGLQAVGLLLIVALLIIPSAAARFWTDRLSSSVVVAAIIGAASGGSGVWASAVLPKLPAGAIIVLAAVFAFGISFIFGKQRGLLRKWLEYRRLCHRINVQHLLRAIYEQAEASSDPQPGDPVPLKAPLALALLMQTNHWNPQYVKQLQRAARRDHLLAEALPGQIQLTAEGRRRAREGTRNHRLWELYLLNYADVAPQHIHHNADGIEHIVEPEIVDRLEQLLASQPYFVPRNPESAPPPSAAAHA